MTTRTDTEGLLREALDAAATWLEVEANHPRQDPVPAMRRQAADLRAALATPPDTDPSPATTKSDSISRGLVVGDTDPSGLHVEDIAAAYAKDPGS